MRKARAREMTADEEEIPMYFDLGLVVVGKAYGWDLAVSL